MTNKIKNIEKVQKEVNFVITEGTTDKSGKSCYSIEFKNRLSDQDFKTFVSNINVFQGMVNGKFSKYNVSKKTVDFDVLNDLLSSFKYTKAEKSTKEIKTPKNELKKQINAKNPAGTAKTETKQDSKGAQITALKDLFNEGIIDKAELLEMIKSLK